MVELVLNKLLFSQQMDTFVPLLSFSKGRTDFLVPFYIFHPLDPMKVEGNNQDCRLQNAQLRRLIRHLSYPLRVYLEAESKVSSWSHK